MECENTIQSRISFLFMAIFAIVAVALFSTISLAATISTKYEFDRPEIRLITVEGVAYHEVNMTGAPGGGNTGQPSLPARGARILIPYNAEVTKIEIIPGKKVYLGSGYNVEPVTMPFPLSIGPDNRSLPRPDQAIYSSTEAFPANTFEEVGTYGFRGYRILTLKLSPVEYIPAAGELSYYPSLTVVVHTVDSEIETPLFRGAPRDIAEVERMVDNDEILATYQAAEKNLMESYTLLIVTSPALAENFQPLKDYHDSTGIPTEIHTTADIGSMNPDDIRDYIRDRYINDGIEYVLIGGDDHIIPPKTMYVATSDGDDFYEELSMPADVYYGCLDGTFDFDGDGFSGEPTDGEGGGDVDLIAEVYVGRAAVSFSSEAIRFVNKTIQYLNTEDAYLGKMLMCGENLRFTGLGEYGGNSLDEMIDGSDEHGYSTVGMPSSVYEIDRLYDLEYPGNDWPSVQVSYRINNGVHAVNHYGHCNADWALKMTGNTALGSFTNDDLCFIYSQGCIAGQFDGFDGWAEKVHVKTDYGAFAAIMNARFGFGMFGNTDGPSQRFNREFWDAIYNPDENIPELSRANQDSKEDNLYRINEECMRWCYYELNLFGDPTIQFKTRPGIIFGYPGDVPDVVIPDETTPVEVEITCVNGGSLISGSGQLHYILNDEPLQTVAMTETAPSQYTATLPELSCEDILQFYVSVEEAVNGRLYDPDPGTPHIVNVGDSTITIYEDDFETENGWLVEGQWARGIPTGGGGDDQQYFGEDPTSGCDGPNVYGYNLDGDYPNYLSEQHLTTTPFDFSLYDNVNLHFMRWLGVERPSYDHAYIRVSTDNINWTTVWENSSKILDNGWYDVSYDLPDFVAGEPAVYLRWTMGNTSSSTKFCGWNIDDVRLTSYVCSPKYVCGDANGDGDANIADAVFLISYVFKGGPAPEPTEAGDANGDGDCNIGDAVYVIGYVFSGGPDPLCP